MTAADSLFAQDVQHMIDTKTKPLGALGDLEQIAKQICLIQNTLKPELKNPHMLVFAGDHGIAEQGVSAYPQEVTWQMVMNFVSGGAAINVFCEQNGLKLKVVDAGVNYDFPEHLPVVAHKIAKGTTSFLFEKAMTKDQLDRAIDAGISIVAVLAQTDCNVVAFGEMGIANTSSATAIINQLTEIDLEALTGRGTGLNDEQLANKLQVLQDAISNHGDIRDPREVLQTYGGFEIAQMVGAMLEAKSQNMLILVDGFIASAAYLVAHTINSDISENAIFCHKSQEIGHQKLLDYLSAKPLLDMNLRLGEGSGCALAYPLVKSAVEFVNKMASFESAGVSEA